MKDLHTDQDIKDVRRHLYQRGVELDKVVRHELSDNKIDVARNWGQPESAEKTNDLRSGVRVGAYSTETDSAAESENSKPKRSYRSFVMIGSLLIFIFVAVVSSLFLYFGGNGISSDNIQIVIEGKPLVGGGEVLPLQITVDNKNRVAIESATLILKYPPGTRSAGESTSSLYEERIPLNDIAAGEQQKIPVRVVVYGKENSEQSIEATVEYRMNGSNGVFYKNSAPLAYRISSAPLIIKVDTVEKVSSGQLIDVMVTVSSNASTPLKNILLTASYPNGFSYETASPEPSYGQNVWNIAELLPEEAVEIKMQGVINGLTEEKMHINFVAGTASSDNPNIVDATLLEASTEFVIENPFIDINIAINRDESNVVIPEGEDASVSLTINNTLDETVYDLVVEVESEGNALLADSISSFDGFYDSNKGVVRWEVSNNADFEKVFPGDSRFLEFTVAPSPKRTTASFDLLVKVYARRVGEDSATEHLIGSNKIEAKYSSRVKLGSQVEYQAGGGPIPPKVGETTVYTVTFVAEAGVNDVKNAVMDTSLPVYVKWLDQYSGDGAVVYNSVSKKVQWQLGEIGLQQRKEMSFQVEIKPSTSQIDISPVLVNSQQFKANDLFTSALLQDSSPAVTTELSTEMGHERGNGVVIK